MRRSFAWMSKMLVLGELDVRKALDLNDCLEINRKALISVADGTAFVPSRLGLPYPHNPNLKVDEESSISRVSADWTLIKPAAYYCPDPPHVLMGMKMVSVRGNNPSKGLPLVPATIFLLDAQTGIVKATLSGTYATVARTSAGPALAVQAFQQQAQNLVLFGAGAQAECHVNLMELALKRKIPRITIINRSRDRAESLRDRLLVDRDGVVKVVLLSDSEAVASALSTADVVAATTNSNIPLWEDGSILKKGCLITGIGSYTPDMQEIPESAVNRCHVIIDTPEAMQVGDLKHLGGFGSSSHPITLAGHWLKDPSAIPLDKDCVFYKAVGTAIQDILTAQSIFEQARNQGIGQEVDMQ